MSKDEKKNIKLIGKNKEDLKVISAYIQDSLVKVGDMGFLKKNRIFLVLVNRFMWENAEKDRKSKNKRIRCALKFEGILKVKSKNINQKNKSQSLEFLAIECNDVLDGNYEIFFFFAGGGMLTLISEFVEINMHDIGESWIVKHIPKHKI
jgi:hypothetical protein